MPDSDNGSLESSSSTSSDVYTETEHTSWFERIKNALVGILVGLVLIPASIVGIFWNEGRAVTTSRSLKEGAGLVVSVDAAKVDPANQGKLVHVAGPAAAAAKLKDPDLAVSAEALRLVRVVEMYQWKERRETETKTNVGGSETKVTRYYYDKVWAEGRNNSSSFKQPSGHENPEPRLAAFSVTAKDASLGAYKPGESVISRVSAGTKLPVPGAAVEAAKARFGTGAHLTGDSLCICTDPGSPRIGDLRISYRILPAGPLSIIGAQSGSDFAPYQTKAGDALLMVETGVKPADAMFKGAQQANTILTWVIRAVAAIAMWIGFMMLFGPFVVLADVIPFLGSILGIGAGLAALVATLVVAPVSIAIAWFAYRPIVSAIVLGGGLVLAWLLRRSAPRRAPAVAPPPVQTAPAAGTPGGASRGTFLPPRPGR